MELTLIKRYGTVLQLDFNRTNYFFKLEMDDLSELTDSFLISEIINVANNGESTTTGSNPNLAFKKPARPGRK